MKKKMILSVCAALILSTTACGGSSTSTPVSTATETIAEETQTVKAETIEAETQAITETADTSAPFKFETDEYSVEYVKHEVGKDYEDNPCLLVYYNFTNKSDEATSAMIVSYMQAFQNGVQSDIAITMDDSKEASNYQKEIQKDITLEVRQAFVIEDMSDVTLEVSDLISFDNNKVVQILTLQ